MPLDNTAKLADIITALQTMEGINAKAELASVVGSPANADDTMATINSVIQGAKNTLAAKMDDGSSGAESLQGLVDNLVNGSKKWASGTITSGTSTISIAGSGTTANFYPATSIGLTFKPNVVILYSSDINATAPVIFKRDYIYRIFNAPYQVRSDTTTGVLGYNEQTSIYVNETGFQLGVSDSGKLYSWIAFE